MKFRLVRAVVHLLAAFVFCCVPSALLAQEELYEKFKSSDFQNRAAVEAVARLVREAKNQAEALVPIEEGLAEVLDEPASTRFAKQEACRLLSLIATDKSVPSVSRLLAEPETADMARYVLERDTDPAASMALRIALKTATGKVRIGIINSLGDKSDPLAVGVIKKYIESTDAQTADCAIVALGKIGTPPAIELLLKQPSRNLAVGHALLRAAARLSGSGDVRGALDIFTRLAQPGHPVVIRAEAIRGLAVRNSTRAAAAAVAALRDDSKYLQESAARTIGTIGTDAAVKPALAEWPDLARETKIVLLTAFADRRDVTAIPLAYTAMESHDAGLRAAGIRAAAIIGGPDPGETVNRLVKLLMHGETSDRQTARESLATIPGKEADQALLKLAGSGRNEVRAAIMPVLAERPTPNALAAMLKAAKSDNTALATEALKAIAKSGRTSQFAEVLAILVHAMSDDIRDEARDTIGVMIPRLPDHGAAAIYAEFPTASNATKAAFCTLLPDIADDRALKELSFMAVSTGSELRQPACSALAEDWSDSRALPILLEIARTDTDRSIRVQTLRGYLRLLGQDETIKPEAKAEAIKIALNFAVRPEEKRQAISILKESRCPASVELCASLLDDKALFPDAAAALIILGAKQKKKDTEQPALTGPTMQAALDKIIAQTTDKAQRKAAQDIRGI